ncbi:MAG: hypothetical protein C4294_16595, partial [Nitrospiraceae bacterium]
PKHGGDEASEAGPLVADLRLQVFNHLFAAGNHDAEKPFRVLWKADRIEIAKVNAGPASEYLDELLFKEKRGERSRLLQIIKSLLILIDHGAARVQQHRKQPRGCLGFKNSLKRRPLSAERLCGMAGSLVITTPITSRTPKTLRHLLRA